MQILGKSAIREELATQPAELGDHGHPIQLIRKAVNTPKPADSGIQTDMSIHVQFLYDESVFRFVLRVDGQPVRASALTPYKGGSGATQSHFIVLADR